MINDKWIKMKDLSPGTLIKTASNKFYMIISWPKTGTEYIEYRLDKKILNSYSKFSVWYEIENQQTFIFVDGK